MAIAAPDFDYIRDLVRKKAAIVLEDGKEYLAETRLQPVARDAGLDSVADLVARLRKGAGPLHEQVVDALTTNETSFFRDIHPFESLRTAVLPELIERRRTTRSIRIWCGASSSGQEPYTIALVIREHFPELASWKIDISATDISPSMLARAATGRFSRLEVNRGLPARLLVKHFTQVGGDYQLNDDVRRLVRFSPLNLATTWPVMPPTDLVFLRNVLIYFDVEMKKAILGKIRRVMAKDGLLLLGGAETTLNLDSELERVPYGKTNWYRTKDHS